MKRKEFVVDDRRGGPKVKTGQTGTQHAQDEADDHEFQHDLARHWREQKGRGGAEEG